MRTLKEEALTTAPIAAPVVPRSDYDPKPRTDVISHSTRTTPVELDLMSDEQLDALTPEEIANITSEIESFSIEETLLELSPDEAIVVESDSWFDYSPAGLDIIACLRKFHRHKIADFELECSQQSSC